MKLRKPAHFDTFRCIASACPDSCCKEWDVQIDPDKADFYRNLSGALGDELRRVMKDEDGQALMTIENGRCPMWRTDGLCRIQTELGEDALCKTCRDFPRLTHDYGDFVEMGLELSCPEAARIIMTSPAPEILETEIPGGEEPEYDTEAMAVLLHTRETLWQIFADASRPVNELLALALMFGYHAQSQLDGAEPKLFDCHAALNEARQFAAPGSTQPILDFYKGLEILTEAWSARLEAPSPTDWMPEHLSLARYFTDRYWLQAVSDYDLVSRIKFMIISCLMIKTLGGDTLSTAQLYSKEIENSIDNVEALLDAAYTGAAFTDDRLLGLLLL